MTAALCTVRVAPAIIFALAGVAKPVNRTDTGGHWESSAYPSTFSALVPWPFRLWSS